jgi:hypothetical protein
VELGFGGVGKFLRGDGGAVSTVAGAFTSGFVNSLASFLALVSTAGSVAGLALSLTTSRCLSSRTGVVVKGNGVGFAVTAGFATGRTSRRTGTACVGLASGIALGATVGGVVGTCRTGGMLFTLCGRGVE